jgi:chromosome segregation ATPase
LAAQIEELHGTLSGHLQSEKEQQERTSGLERQLREREEIFARSATDLESERGERRRVEQRTTALSAQLQELHEKLQAQLQVEKDHQGRIGNLERQLQDRQGELERLDDALRTEKADRHLAEEQLEAAGELASRLQQYQGAFEETRSGFARAREEMQTRLQDSLNALNESEARWKKEVAERQRLVDALEAAQRDHRLQSQESAAQLASLQSNLQAESMERRRMESEAAHSRFASLGSARSGRTQIQDLRKRVQQPVEGLMRSSRQLLELELREEQKKVAESLHENILLLQKRLQETDSVGASSTRSDSPVPGETSLPTEPRNAVDAAS